MPAHYLHMPFPMAAADIPIILDDHKYGCLSVRWSQTDLPRSADVQYLQSAANKLGAEFEAMAARNISLDAPIVPHKLHQDFLQQGDAWQNNTLATFLEALAAWMYDSPGFYQNFGKELPAGGDWTFIARALQAATVYE